MNTDVYEFVALALQAAQLLNITPPVWQKYNVPSGNNTISTLGNPPPTLTSYSQVAIAGADSFFDAGVTIKDVFDVIVSNTRDITPTCEFSTPSSSYLLTTILLTRPQSSRNCLDTWVCTRVTILQGHVLKPLRYEEYGWPVRSVEQLPPYTPTKLKYPVLVIGNTVRPHPEPIYLISNLHNS